MKRKNTGGRASDEGRDLGDPLTSQGMPTISSKRAEARREEEQIVPHSRRNQPRGHLILDFHPLKW